VNDPVIRISHLYQGYETDPVVHDLSLEVGRGEIFGFIGPNGAGKTTTIRTMATLLVPRAGKVEICGMDVSVEPDRVRKKVGYMPDHAGVYDRLTVLETLEFFARASGVKRAGVTAAVLELVDLGSLSDKLVATLSKGMRQRLQLARVLLHDPEVLILDEPASDLDPRARIEIRDLLLELKELGKTIFLSSHILSELSDVCTSVGIIEKGRLLVSGPIGAISGSAALHALPPTAHPALPPGQRPDHEQAPVPTDEASHGVEAPVDGEARAAPPTETTLGGATIPAQTQRRLKLRVLGEAATVRPLLEACPPIKAIESEDGNLIVARYVGDDRFVAELVRYLVSHGVGIVGVEPERSILEQVFLQVTKGELQ
jgi:ABC-2 type transport system ATP-binding protein